LKAGISYVRHRPDILIILVIIFIIGTFGMNFAIFAATMASEVFHHGAGEFGVLSSMIAIGSTAGALLAARRERPRMRVLFVSCAAFGITTALAAVMPSYWMFGAALVLVGFTAITLMTTANSLVQTTTAPVMRGRVMALYMAVFMGGTPLGAPIIGLVANVFGPRWALGVGALSGIVACAIGVIWMVVSHDLRLHYRGGLRLTHDRSVNREDARDELAVDEALTRA
jgi:MFS family permease